MLSRRLGFEEAPEPEAFDRRSGGSRLPTPMPIKMSIVRRCFRPESRPNLTPSKRPQWTDSFNLHHPSAV
jgi:hypothetical protein